MLRSITNARAIIIWVMHRRAGQNYQTFDMFFTQLNLLILSSTYCVSSTNHLLFDCNFIWRIETRDIRDLRGWIWEERSEVSTFDSWWKYPPFNNQPFGQFFVPVTMLINPSRKFHIYKRATFLSLLAWFVITAEI